VDAPRFWEDWSQLEKDQSQERENRFLLTITHQHFICISKKPEQFEELRNRHHCPNEKVILIDHRLDDMKILSEKRTHELHEILPGPKQFDMAGQKPHWRLALQLLSCSCVHCCVGKRDNCKFQDSIIVPKGHVLVMRKKTSQQLRWFLKR
jgi:hypothetical protein